MQLDLKEVEELSKTLYIRALKLLPRDIKQGFERLLATETDATGKTILGTMVENIAVAERTRNLLCQDTGIPIYNIVIGRNVEFDGAGMKEAIRRGCERATKEHPLRSSVVHPITRKNEQTSCGIGVPLINVDFDTREETVASVARMVGLTRQSVQQTADAMEAEGLITYIENPHHRRAQLMEPTAAARAALARLRPREIDFANLMGRPHTLEALDAALAVLRRTREALEAGIREQQR